MREFLKLGIVLMLVCAVAAGTLAMTKKYTEPIIKKQTQINEQSSLKEVLPDTDKFADKTKTFADLLEPYANQIQSVFIGYKDGRVNGIVVKVSSFGYSSAIQMLVGVKDGKTTNLKVISQTETPGLGTKVTEKEFISQFVGRRSGTELKVKKDGGDIQAITGATISSRAVTKGISTVLAFAANSDVVQRLGNPSTESIKKNVDLSFLKDALPEADSFTDRTEDLSNMIKPYGKKIEKVYVGYKNKAVAGVLVKALTQGYSGPIKMLVVTKDGKVAQVRIISHNEMPDIGEKATKKSFLDQFINKAIGKALKVKQDGGEIQEVTGATISSKGVTNGVSSVLGFLGNKKVQEIVIE